MIITLDGLAGSGKTTLSKYFASHYVIINPKTNTTEKILHMSSGEFYRIITLCALTLQPTNVVSNNVSHKNLENTEKNVEQFRSILKKHYKKFTQNIIWDSTGINNKLLHGFYKSHSKLVTALYSSDISLFSAQLASYGPMRSTLNDKMRTILQSNAHWIIEGRDAGTNIVKNPSLRVYLEADTKIRAKRRTIQYQLATERQNTEEKKSVGILNTQKEITQRDYLDTHRGKHSIKKDSKAYYIDTSLYTIEQICKKLYNKIKQTSYKICRR